MRPVMEIGRQRCTSCKILYLAGGTSIASVAMAVFENTTEAARLFIPATTTSELLSRYLIVEYRDLLHGIKTAVA